MVWYDVPSSTTGPDNLAAVVRNKMRSDVHRLLTEASPNARGIVDSLERTVGTTLARIFHRPMSTLLLFDTNVVMDIWLGRDGDEAALLLTLAERHRVDLIVPEFVLIEFQGTARRWVRDQRVRLTSAVRSAANEWGRSDKLGDGADDIRAGADKVAAALDDLERNVTVISTRLSAIAHVEAHSAAIHFRGDLRYLRGDPPDRPVDGLKDCRIYEAILEILQADDASQRRDRVFVTKDRDFATYAPIVDELAALGTMLRADSRRPLSRTPIAGHAPGLRSRRERCSGLARYVHEPAGHLCVPRPLSRVYSAGACVYSSSSPMDSLGTCAYSLSSRVYSPGACKYSTSPRAYPLGACVYSTSPRAYPLGACVYSTSPRAYPLGACVYSTSPRAYPLGACVYSTSPRVYSPRTCVYSSSPRGNLLGTCVNPSSSRVYSPGTCVNSSSSRPYSPGTCAFSSCTRAYSLRNLAHEPSPSGFASSTRPYRLSPRCRHGQCPRTCPPSQEK